MLGGRTFPCSAEGEVKTIYSNNGEFCPIDRDALLRGAQLTDTLSIQGNILVLVAWIVCARLLGYFALKLLHTGHKPRASTWKR